MANTIARPPIISRQVKLGNLFRDAFLDYGQNRLPYTPFPVAARYPAGINSGAISSESISGEDFLAVGPATGSAIGDATASAVINGATSLVGSAIGDSTASAVGTFATIVSLPTRSGNQFAIASVPRWLQLFKSSQIDCWQNRPAFITKSASGAASGDATASAVGDGKTSLVGTAAGDATASAASSFVQFSFPTQYRAFDGRVSRKRSLFVSPILDNVQNRLNILFPPVAGGTVSGVGSAIGDATAAAIGVALLRAVGEASGDATAIAIGAANAFAAGLAIGDARAAARTDRPSRTRHIITVPSAGRARSVLGSAKTVISREFGRRAATTLAQASRNDASVLEAWVEDGWTEDGWMQIEIDYPPHAGTGHSATTVRNRAPRAATEVF